MMDDEVEGRVQGFRHAADGSFDRVKVHETQLARRQQQTSC